ncbi:MAG: hypothetical protein H0Z28_02620 [Archaeoglobus sp.]|nr:hypothetical protein [Archaeoglobus sp.]
MESYLERAYKWLIEGRKVKRVLVYAHGYKKPSKKFEERRKEIERERIKLIGPQREILKAIENWVREKHRELGNQTESIGIKTNNLIIKMIEFLEKGK